MRLKFGGLEAGPARKARPGPKGSDLVIERIETLALRAPLDTLLRAHPAWFAAPA